MTDLVVAAPREEKSAAAETGTLLGCKHARYGGSPHHMEMASHSSPLKKS